MILSKYLNELKRVSIGLQRNAELWSYMFTWDMVSSAISSDSKDLPRKGYN